MDTRKINYKSIIKYGLIIAVIWGAVLFAVPKITSEEFKVLAEELGILGPIAVVSYITLSHIVAPVVGAPIVFSSIGVFGIYETMFYAYLGGVISAVINFYISRLFGRQIITRLVGKKTMKEVDQFAESSGTATLIFGRVIGFSLFEIVSYAAGLTSMSFVKYLIITVIFSAIPTFAFAFLFRNSDFSTVSNVFAWLAVLAGASVVFAFIFKKYFIKRTPKVD